MYYYLVSGSFFDIPLTHTRKYTKEEFDYICQQEKENYSIHHSNHVIVDDLVRKYGFNRLDYTASWGLQDEIIP